MSDELTSYTTHSGEKINFRLVKKGDASLLVDMFHRLSSETKRLRFHLYTTKIPEERIWSTAKTLSDLDPQRQVAIVATVQEEDEERAVGVARFARSSAKDMEAEVAIVVRDDFQRKGLGRHLLTLLADKALEMGITHFTGWVTTRNFRLMKLIKKLKLKNVESKTRHGERKIRIPLTQEDKE